MNFFTWEREHGKHYADIVDSGDISGMPAFAESSGNEISNKIGEIIEKRLIDGKSIMEMIPIICEYLYEEYHITPMDVEILSQYVMFGTLKLTMESAERAGKLMGTMLRGDDGNEDS